MSHEPNTPCDKIIQTLLEAAVKAHATEIHIEPQRGKVRVHITLTGLPTLEDPRLTAHDCLHTRVRYRLSGRMQEHLRLPLYVLEPLITRLKELAATPTSKPDGFHQGHISVGTGGQATSWQITIGPTELGHKAVMQQIID
jgi:type II secretory ATPase GspE/PulE/Tfp pilus assembly ATPase PilB-like protein